MHSRKFRANPMSSETDSSRSNGVIRSPRVARDGASEPDVDKSDVFASSDQLEDPTIPEHNEPIENSAATNDAECLTVATYANTVTQADFARQLLDEFRRRVRWQIMRLGGSCQDIDDITHDVIVALLKKGKLEGWDRTKGMTLVRFAAFLARYDFTKCLVRQGRWHRVVQLSRTEDEHYEIQSLDTPELALAASQLLEQLYERISDRLSALGLLFFRLLFLEQCSIEEAASRSRHSIVATHAWSSRLSKIVQDCIRQIDCRGTCTSGTTGFARKKKVNPHVKSRRAARKIRLVNSNKTTK